MNWYTKFLMGQILLMDDNNGGNGGGGAPAAPTAKVFADLKDVNAKLLERLDKLEKAGNPNPTPNPTPKPDDQSLSDQAKLQREAADKTAKQSKQLESAIRFNIGSKEFMKENESLLPKNLAGLLDIADKQNYDSEISKANAVREGIIMEFFTQQSNLDLLTPGLKSTLDDYKKLTKSVREERAQEVYEAVFEPAMQMLKQMKKAEEMRKGAAPASNSETAYLDKLTKSSRAHYMRGKANA